jgi:hypothetical protein
MCTTTSSCDVILHSSFHTFHLLHLQNSVHSTFKFRIQLVFISIFLPWSDSPPPLLCIISEAFWLVSLCLSMQPSPYFKHVVQIMSLLCLNPLVVAHLTHSNRQRPYHVLTGSELPAPSDPVCSFSPFAHGPHCSSSHQACVHPRAMALVISFA